MLGHDSVYSNFLSRVRKVARDGADVTSGGRHFHTWEPATENAGCQQRSGELEAEWGSRYRKAKLSATWKVSSVGDGPKYHAQECYKLVWNILCVT